MSIFLGIDVGSLSTDAVLMDEKKNILKEIIVPTGASLDKAIEKCISYLTSSVNEDVILVSTGYGRRRVKLATPITEITAHALGAVHFFPNVSTVIDIGGQDTKVIKISSQGQVEDFVMNDRCSAGTGRFLEVMARVLEMDLEEMAKNSLKAEHIEAISSTCTVFAESEVISLLSKGSSIPSISAGIFQAIAQRVVSMVKQIRGTPPFVLSGGVAKNKGVVKALKDILTGDVLIPPNPQITGAIGCVIYAINRHISKEYKP